MQKRGIITAAVLFNQPLGLGNGITEVPCKLFKRNTIDVGTHVFEHLSGNAFLGGVISQVVFGAGIRVICRIKPVLGYNDEGNPETADWEIKYLVEHGIDFQAFCVFPDKSDAPLKMDETAHLYDGFMNPKYSDMSHFAVIWEAAAGKKPTNMEAWKKYFVPYFNVKRISDSDVKCCRLEREADSQISALTRSTRPDLWKSIISA